MLEVRIHDGRSAEQATRVRVADFEGPLALLLSLIESRRLDVLTVPLGALAGAYLEALAAVPVDRLANVSAFVAVASQLILIKSRALLPRQPAGLDVVAADEGPDPEAELRARLVIYRAHRDAARRLETAATARRLFRREPATAAAAGRAGARPARVPSLHADLLARALASIARIMPVPPSPPEVMPRTVTIEQRVDIIREALRWADSLVLQELLDGVRDRAVQVVTFLALLELVKLREVTVEQREPWGPIVARRIGPVNGAA